MLGERARRCATVFPSPLWWVGPFTIGLLLLAVAGWLGARALGLGIGGAIGRELGRALRRNPLFFADDRPPDLDLAPGAPGYLPSLGLAGRQLHFHGGEFGVTWIAVDAVLGGTPVRIPAAEYDGPPSRAVASESLRPEAPPVPMLVVRAPGGAEIFWAEAGSARAQGPIPAGADGTNVLVLPGKLALWAGDGPRLEIEVAPRETVSCTLGPAGFAIDRRQLPPAAPR